MLSYCDESKLEKLCDGVVQYSTTMKYYEDCTKVKINGLYKLPIATLPSNCIKLELSDIHIAKFFDIKYDDNGELITTKTLEFSELNKISAKNISLFRPAFIKDCYIHLHNVRNIDYVPRIYNLFEDTNSVRIIDCGLIVSIGTMLHFTEVTETLLNDEKRTFYTRPTRKSLREYTY